MLEAFFIIRYNSIDIYLAVLCKQFYFIYQRPYSGQISRGNVKITRAFPAERQNVHEKEN
jgi:hypothetical protein